MPLSFWSSVSIAAWPLAWSPRVGAAPTICGSPSLMPKPFRKPSWRSCPTEMPGARSSIAIFGLIFISLAFAAAYWPISSPALRLSVANSASAASCGSVGVSSAITITPASRAFLIAGTMAFESAGTSRMTLAPCVVMFSIAVTWLALSVSCLPEAVSSLTLSFLACACAPSFIFTKNGFVSVLVMRPIVTSSSFLAAPPPPPLSSSSPHATAPTPSAATAASAASCLDPRPKRIRPSLIWALLLVYGLAPSLARQRFQQSAR